MKTLEDCQHVLYSSPDWTIDFIPLVYNKPITDISYLNSIYSHHKFWQLQGPRLTYRLLQRSFPGHHSLTSKGLGKQGQ